VIKDEIVILLTKIGSDTKGGDGFSGTLLPLPKPYGIKMGITQ
jgi:hypothetical protein